MREISNAYTLTVRQHPERGKAFSGPKEKGELQKQKVPEGRLSCCHALGMRQNAKSGAADRKPIDPPPIIQLRINDPQDPAASVILTITASGGSER